MKIKSTLLTLLLSGISFAQIQFPQVSSKSRIDQQIGLSNFQVDYFRPNLNNRTAFGGIAPYGEVWRTGANNNTTIEFDTDLLVEGKPLFKGKYSLYTIPNKNTWDLIFYKATDNWGNPKQWDENNIALKVTVPTVKLNDKLETFTIGFEDVTTDAGNLALAWDTTKIKAKIAVPTQQLVVRSIETYLNANSSPRDFYGAANYYFNNNLDLKKAQQWINKAIELDAKAPQHFKDLKVKIDDKLK